MQKFSDIIRKGSWFLVPCLVWWVVAGLLVFHYSGDQLFFDLNGHWDRFLDWIMPITTCLGNGWTFVVLLLVLLVFRKFRAFFIGVAVFAISSLICQLLKNWFHQPRPFIYFSGREKLVHYVPGVYIFHFLSFPSGHTTTAFAMFCFLTLVIRDRRFGLVFFLLAIATAWSRVYLGEHFFADIFAGSAIGTVSAIGIQWAADSLFPLRT